MGTTIAAPFSLKQQYDAVRRRTERLCAPLSAEDQMVQSMTEASPAKWHQAHTTWFFETFLLTPNLRGYRPFDAHFRTLFNSYYKQLDGHPNRAMRGNFSRPALAQIMDYRRHVDQGMARLLEHDLSSETAALIELGLNHEQQHQELIVTDIKHAFWASPLRPAYREPLPDSNATSPRLEWIRFEEGLREIGHDGQGFAFDNESPRHRVFTPAFAIASRLVTNAEYLEFMRDGGYRHPELWLSDGWDRVSAERWHAPLYWEEQDGRWLEFTSGGMREVQPSEPVCHVSYYEADAFARWSGARLPTEQEWEVAAELPAVNNEPSAVSHQPSAANLLESGRFHPVVASREKNLNGSALSQVFGDAWEWTASAYLPYPGYRAAPGALGEYNGKFMSGQMVLRGGSCATPASHIRATYRNFFPPHARWQFMGIRLAHDRA